ncbi:MAG: aspartate/methionine/tyrosine aminotransferase [Gammaproteobacteria bacterium]|jgi:aspartate/methionine/tyrosine aminotransferase
MRLNQMVVGVSAPPIADVNGWVSDLHFSAERPLLNVAQAVPSYAPAQSLIEHVASAAGDAASAAYAPILGLAPLREAFAQHMTQIYGSAVQAGELAITAGCNQAFCVALSALAAPGDQVLLPVPWYFNHQMWMQMQGIEVCPLAFDEGAGGVPSVAVAAAAITDRTRAIVLVTPNNPTGNEYPQSLLEDFFDLAVERGVTLVIDETYKDFRSHGGPPHALFARPNWREHLVSLHSFSKSYAMAGYRVGALVGGPQLLRSVQKILDCITICTPQLGQRAALHALQHLDEWRDQKVVMMAARVAALRAAFLRNELTYQLVSSGTFFAWVRHPFVGEPATDVARRLAREHGVLCVPGTTFGPGLEGYLRFAFANLQRESMATLVDRLLESQTQA